MTGAQFRAYYRTLILVLTLACVMAPERAVAQAESHVVSFAAGGVLRDTDGSIGSKFGTIVNLAFEARPEHGKTSLDVRLATMLLRGPNNFTPVSGGGGFSASSFPKLSAFVAFAPEIRLRYYVSEQSSTAYLAVGGGGLGAYATGPDPEWDVTASIAAGYIRSLGNSGGSVFSEVAYTRVIGAELSPHWLTPVLVGVRWRVGGP